MAETTMLEKVDILRSRCRISYRDAYETLERNGGNVIRALIELEDREHAAKPNVLNALPHLPGKVEERITVMGHELMDKLQEIVKTGQNTKIRVMRDGRTVFKVPTAVGAVGALLFPAVTVVATAAAMASRYEIVLDKRPQNQQTEDSDTGHDPVLVNVHTETFDPLDNGHRQINPSISSGKVGSV
ncbi:DUF4342 domain-containing protein [Tumebacillus sp. DT12]|uniref:DUF4342 domain-containing protein n=1 Tax=Tumebacillus lacus TaxID=2995335 RepID=A0ABT3X4R7_9BACL|nr:DUF4342 domain-containing protein [Tumebacillus lacus]MCX7570832.1 DUF4342 domain-containing protein [Tumebacillus lacus]